MDAGSILRRALLAATALTLILSTATANAGNGRTQNFIVHAPNHQLAETVAQAAEKYRHDLAVYWLGKPLPAWPTPCPIRVIAGPRLAAQGVTTYNPQPVRDFQMEVVGTPERILDSVLPHEVTHTILATHFGRPLPRWADEGICTTVEHSAERNKHELKLREFLGSRRGIAMNQLFLMTEYPNDVLPMYAQGYSVCRFLIDQKGPNAFIAFLHDYMRHPSWTDNVKKHYEYDSLKELQDYWLAWVADGSRSVGQFAKSSPGAPNGSNPSGLPPASATLVAATEIPAPPADLNSGNLPAAKSPTPNSLGRGSLQLADPRGVRLDPAPATALAKTSPNLNDGDSWYQRQKQQAQPGPTTDTPTHPAVIMPPSVRESGPYQSAHPQPMQGTGTRSGTYSDRGRRYR